MITNTILIYVTRSPSKELVLCVSNYLRLNVYVFSSNVLYLYPMET